MATFVSPLPVAFAPAGFFLLLCFLAAADPMIHWECLPPHYRSTLAVSAGSNETLENDRKRKKEELKGENRRRINKAPDPVKRGHHLLRRLTSIVNSVCAPDERPSHCRRLARPLLKAGLSGFHFLLRRPGVALWCQSAGHIFLLAVSAPRPAGHGDISASKSSCGDVSLSRHPGGGGVGGAREGHPKKQR